MKTDPINKRPDEANETGFQPPSGSGETAEREACKPVHEGQDGEKVQQPNYHWAHVTLAFPDNLTGHSTYNRNMTEHMTKLEQWARKDNRILCIAGSELGGLRRDSAGHPHHWQQIHNSHLRLCVVMPFRELNTLEVHLPADWGDRYLSRYPNVCLGLIIDEPKNLNQIEGLKKVPAKNRMILLKFVKAQIDLKEYLTDGIDWVVVEAGQPEHVRTIRDACLEAGVAFFYGSRDGGAMALDGEIHHAHPFGDKVDLDRPSPLQKEFEDLLVSSQFPAPGVGFPTPPPETVQTASAETASQTRSANETIDETGVAEGGGGGTDQAPAPLPGSGVNAGKQPPVTVAARAKTSSPRTMSLMKPRQAAPSFAERSEQPSITAPAEGTPSAPSKAQESVERPDAGAGESRDVLTAAQPEPLEVDVLDGPPDKITEEEAQQIRDVEKVLTNSLGKVPDDLLDVIKIYSGRAQDFAARAKRAGNSAIVNAWIAGRLMNSVKDTLPHGKFGQWQDDHLVKTDTMSKSTAQRWMRLARKWPNLTTLLSDAPTLRQAYLTSDIIPKPERGETAGSDSNGEDHNPRAEALLSRLSILQKQLRLFMESGQKFGQEEQLKVALARTEINQLIDNILA